MVNAKVTLKYDVMVAIRKRYPTYGDIIIVKIE